MRFAIMINARKFDTVELLDRWWDRDKNNLILKFLLMVSIMYLWVFNIFMLNIILDSHFILYTSPFFFFFSLQASFYSHEKKAARIDYSLFKFKLNYILSTFIHSPI